MEEQDKPGTAGEKQPGLWQKKRREIILGAAIALGLVFLGAWGLRTLMPGHQAVEQTAAATVGLVDMQKAMEAHPDYEKLKDLRSEYQRLTLSLKDTAALPPMTVQPPQTDAKPFDDSVWQKNAQEVIGGRTQLEREAKAVEKAYREAHQAEYESRQKSIDEDYRLAIFNLNLKIDNQKAMHHPWTKQEVLDQEKAEWEQERAALQQERGMRQLELERQWNKQVAAHVQSVMEPKLAAWRQKAQAAMTQRQSDALAKQSEVQARNTDAMQQQMDVSLDLQQREAIRQQLSDIQQQIQALDTHIRNDIAGKAAKIAILHHFTLIVATPAENLDYALPSARTPALDMQRFYPVVGTDTEDVTDELVTEIGTISSEES
ncbi:hypothetical protein [Mitsuokella jalaludinii]|uniref:hypothetical protein n=1 Tax=Mitsuokella jalaludinii TaxID=187979 RepID=UPI003F954380